MYYVKIKDAAGREITVEVPLVFSSFSRKNAGNWNENAMKSAITWITADWRITYWRSKPLYFLNQRKINFSIRRQSSQFTASCVFARRNSRNASPII